MSSREYIKHVVSSNTSINGQRVGDEVYDPIQNKLYKTVPINGTNVDNVEILTSFSPTVDIQSVQTITGQKTFTDIQVANTIISNNLVQVANTVISGNLVLTGTVAGTSSGVGALRVAGGAYFGTNTYTNGYIDTSSGIRIFSTIILNSNKVSITGTTSNSPTLQGAAGFGSGIRLIGESVLTVTGETGVVSSVVYHSKLDSYNVKTSDAAVTYSNLATLLVDKPTWNRANTNITVSNTYSLWANGSIYTANNFVSAGNVIIGGTDGITFADGTKQTTAATGGGSGADQWVRDTANVIIGTDASQNVRIDYSNSAIAIIQGTDVTQNTNIAATDGKMSSAYNQANTGTALAQGAFNQSNASFLGVNTAITIIQGTDASQNVRLDYSNTAITVIQGTDISQNTAIAATDGKMQSAYNQANVTVGVDTTQNTRLTVIENTDLSQNVSIATQNSFITVIQGTDVTQNTNITIIQGVDVGQNSRMAIIEGTNASQNVRIDYSNAAITIIQGVDTTQNTKLAVIENTDLSQNVRLDYSNTAITIIQGTDVTQNTNIAATDGKMQSSYNQANTGTALAQGAFNQSNASFLGVNTAIAIIQGVDTSQNARVTIIEGVDVTQNTNINNKLSLTGAPNQTVSGNVTISQDLIVSGNLIITGNIGSQNVQQLAVSDPLIVLGIGNYTSDTKDIGFAAHYNDGVVNAHSGIIRDSGTKEYYVFKGYTPEVDVTNNVDINDASFAKANLNAGYFKGNLIATTAVVNGLDISSVWTTQNTRMAVIEGTDASQNSRIDYSNTAITIIQGTDVGQNTRLTVIENTDLSQNARLDYSNTAITIIQGTDVTQNSRMAIIEGTDVGQNSRMTIIEGADTSQNVRIDYSNTSITIIQGVDASQNANIVSVQALANTDVTYTTPIAGSYGSSSLVPVVTVASNGRITSITTAAVSGGSGGSSSGYLANSIIFANTSGYLSNTANILFFESNNNLSLANTITAANLILTGTKTGSASDGALRVTGGAYFGQRVYASTFEFGSGIYVQSTNLLLNSYSLNLQPVGASGGALSGISSTSYGIFDGVSTFSDISSSGIQPITAFNIFNGNRILTSKNPVTYPDLATFYISSPSINIANTNLTVTNSWALYANGAIYSNTNIQAANTITAANLVITGTTAAGTLDGSGALRVAGGGNFNTLFSVSINSFTGYSVGSVETLGNYYLNIGTSLNNGGQKLANFSAKSMGGISVGSKGTNFSDTSDTGIVPLVYYNRFLTGNIISAAAAVTYSNIATILIDVPTWNIANTNLTVSNTYSLWANGSIYTANNLVASGGIIFGDGTKQTTAAAGGGGSGADQWVRDTANVIIGTDLSQNVRIDYSNSAITIIQGVDTTQNTRLTVIENTDLSQNTRLDYSNTAITIIQGVDLTQNAATAATNQYATSAYSTANNAYTKANNALANTTGTFAGTLTVTGNVIANSFQILGSSGNISGANFIYANTFVSSNSFVGGTVTASSVVVTNGASVNSTVLQATTATTSQTAIDIWSTSTYRTAKYLISITSASNYHSIELLIVQNGTTPYVAQYAEVITGSSLATFDASISGGNLSLLANPASATSTTYNIFRDTISV